MRCWMTDLTREERDCVLKGQVMAMTDLSPGTSNCKHRQHERQREHTTYYHQGLRVCCTTFAFLYNTCTSIKVLKAIRRSWRDEGLLPRVHGSTKCLPKHTLMLNDVQQVVSFLKNYAEDHGILLPGRIPWYKCTDLQLLPCSTMKCTLHRAYSQAMERKPGVHCVCYTTFCTIWKKLLPHILPARPMTDLCTVCHRNTLLITRSSNLSEVSKSQVRLE